MTAALPWTMTAAGLLGLLLLILAMRCVAVRLAIVRAGDNADRPALEADRDNRMRVMANFAEYVPLCLVLIAGLEASGGPGWVPALLGAALVGGRAFHAWGLSGNAGRSAGRLYGTLATWTVLVLAALGNLMVGGLALAG